MFGICEIYIDDLCEEFIKDFVFLMFWVNVVYEGVYLFGILIVWLLIFKCLIEIVEEIGVDVVVYGVIGKGNDQVWFEFFCYVFNLDIKVIVLWCDWMFKFWIDLINFVEQYQILVFKDKCGEVLFFVDVNMLYLLLEGKVLEDLNEEVLYYVYQWIVDLIEVLDEVIEIEIGFEKGDVVLFNGILMFLVILFVKLNDYGCDNGIGCFDMVENWFVGMKSCGIYEMLGGIIFLIVYWVMELIMFDCGVGYFKDELMLCYVLFIYNGFWFLFECEMLQVLIDKSQEYVIGMVCLKFYKGNVIVIGWVLFYLFYFEELVIFEDDEGVYDQKDVVGFIKLNVLCLCMLVKCDWID